jgi:7,8-dihydroneopterin aldolase/epimerase/oxygenase
MATISITGMEFHAYHGCFKEEQVIGNIFIVDVFLETITTDAEITDDLHKTVNYAAVYSLIKKEMEITSKLIEHVARRILDSIIRSFPQIISIELKVSKMNPPVGGKVDRVSVTLKYEKDGRAK